MYANKHYFGLILLFTILFTIRLWQVEGFHGYYSDIYLEDLGMIFEPWRRYLSQIFNQYLDPEAAAILSGVVLGIKSDLSTNLKNALINTSTIHIVVVSGQNLSLLVASLAHFNGYIGKRLTSLLALIIILAYCLITGLQIPVIRAGIMASLCLIAQIFGRERQSVLVLFISGALMLLYEPRWLLSISFQLSFVATLATLTLTPKIDTLLIKIPSLIRADLSNAIAVQLLIWPLIAFYFQQVSLVGIFVNTLVLWTIGPIMISGGLLLIAHQINQHIASWLSLIPELLITFLLKVVYFSNSIKMNHLEKVILSISFLIGYYFLVLGVFYLLAKKDCHDNQKIDLGY